MTGFWLLHDVIKWSINCNLCAREQSIATKKDSTLCAGNIDNLMLLMRRCPSYYGAISRARMRDEEPREGASTDICSAKSTMWYSAYLIPESPQWAVGGVEWLGT